MSLVALDGTPLVYVGAIRQGGVQLPTVQSTTQDAANEACIMIGQLFWADGGSHTIDTTGSSSLGWRVGAVTLANVGTTFNVGIATVDTTTGPPGRAVNVADVITLDVSRSYTSAAAPSANSWIDSVPTSGTKTIAHAELVAFCTQMTARGGADSIVTQTGGLADNNYSSLVTTFTGAAYSATAGNPNCVVTASDGTLGFFWGGFTFSTTLNTNVRTWNSGSATKEYGNYFQMPFPGKIYGLAANVSIAGNTDIILYSDPFGTPVAEKSHSIDLNTISSVSAGGNRPNVVLFSSPYTAKANQPLAGIIKPTSVTSVDAPYLIMNAATHQGAYPLGTNCYAINRASGAFASENSNKDRYGVALLVSAFEHGVHPTSLIGF